ncbi:MAG: hypothetical protein JSV36_04305 [Anaerolineae bacterium]|nr:MAG: hypothetical protein JSV36_04305 [Anaerolineae bacterium]
MTSSRLWSLVLGILLSFLAFPLFDAALADQTVKNTPPVLDSFTPHATLANGAQEYDQRTAAAIDLTKQASASIIYAGDPVTYTYRISNASLVSLDRITLIDDRLGTLIAPPPRITGGLVVLYTFEEDSGTTVHDVSGTDPPLDLTIADRWAVSWIPGGGLSIDSPTIVASTDAATKVADSCRATDEISIEAWLKPSDAASGDSSPARIVTLSKNKSKRNFSLGQGMPADQRTPVYDVRLRTTETSDNGLPSLYAPEGSLTAQLSHVVYTRSASGMARLYINGIEQANGNIGGNFSGWDDSFRLALANELSLASKHLAWSGEYHLVAIYNRALSQAEVRQNFEARAGLTLGPDQSITTTASTRLYADTTNTATATGTDSLVGVVSDSDSAFVNTLQRPGPNGEGILALSVTPSATCVEAGTPVTYTYAVTNTSQDCVNNVVVTDDRFGFVSPAGGVRTLDVPEGFTLEAGESRTLTIIATLNRSTVNVAQAGGEDLLETLVLAQATAYVRVPGGYAVFLPIAFKNGP